MAEYTVERVEKDLETWDCITFPNGSQMIYVEVPGFENARNHHTYWRAHPDWKRSKQLAGASSMVSTFDLRQDNLQKWIGREAAASGDADPGREKRELGTRVHEAFESLALGKPFPELEATREEDKGYIRGLMRWWESRRPEVLACEQFVFHGDLGFGGRYDLRARINGRIQLIDLKTANNLYPKYGAQLVAYDAASEWCGLGIAHDLVILKVCENGDFFEVPAFVTRDEFLEAMNVRKVAGRVRTQQNAYLKAAA